MTVWLQVAKEVDGAASDVVEVPLEDDNTLLLSSLTSQFARAQGLRYRNEANGVHRAVRCSGDKLHPPDDGWADRVYLVVEKQDDPSPRRPSSSVYLLDTNCACACPVANALRPSPVLIGDLYALLFDNRGGAQLIQWELIPKAFA